MWQCPQIRVLSIKSLSTLWMSCSASLVSSGSLIVLFLVMWLAGSVKRGNVVSHKHGNVVSVWVGVPLGSAEW